MDVYALEKYLIDNVFNEILNDYKECVDLKTIISFIVGKKYKFVKPLKIDGYGEICGLINHKSIFEETLCFIMDDDLICVEVPLKYDVLSTTLKRLYEEI